MDFTGNKHVFRCFNVSFFLFLLACHGIVQERDKIVFQNPTAEVEDSIVVMNSFMDSLIVRRVYNVFFDSEDILTVNNKKMGRMADGDSINFFDIVRKETGFSETQATRFLSLALFLKDNFMPAWFKHGHYGIYFYVYKHTSRNEYNDLRNIIVSNEEFSGIKGSLESESFKILDQVGNLILITPATQKE